VWALLHQETRLSSSHVRLILLVALLLAALAAAAVVPRVLLVLEQASASDQTKILPGSIMKPDLTRLPLLWRRVREEG
jgi:hypothetical protein